MSGVETGDGVELFLLPEALLGNVNEPCEAHLRDDYKVYRIKKRGSGENYLMFD